MAMIKQRFSRDIENEALDTIADTEFRKFVEAETQRVVGTPALTDIKKSSEGVEFTIRYEVLPEFELGNYRGLELQRPEREITDEDVQDEIDRLTLRASSFETAERTDGTMYVVTFAKHLLDAETSLPVIGAAAEEERVFLDDDSVDMHLRNSLSDKAVGDSVTYVAETSDENSQPPSYRLTISDIQRVIPAEFSNEFVETITGGKLASTEELRQDLHKQLTQIVLDEQKRAVEQQLVDALVNAHEFEPPKALVHAVVHQLFEDFKERNKDQPGIEKLDAHALEAQLKPNAERIVRWELIREKIIAAENITITDEDLLGMATQYGVEVDQIRMIMRQQRQMEDQMLADKAVRTLLDYAVITNVGAPADILA
jgi:trigger factor